MSIFTARHQFEIRYTAILDFPNTIRKSISPFVKLANRISIDQEYSHNERITLFFDDDYYQIAIMWDRIFIKFEGDKEMLNENNSIVEEPFFNILAKIQEQDNFGEINNTLYYSFILLPGENQESPLPSFMETYLGNYHKIMEEPTDAAIILENKNDGLQTTLTLGPYFGDQDLAKRNIKVKSPMINKIKNKLGYCFELKILNTTKAVKFADYKRACRIEKSFIDKL